MYLPKCLDSILTQDIPFADYEIVIINDGSTDKSFEIAQSYAKSFQSFRLFSQEKTGVGAARNVGILQSTGKYLFFVDGDDYLQSNCLGKILDCADKNSLDLLRFNYEAANEKDEILPKKRNSTKSIVFSEQVVDGSSFLSQHLGWACYAWSFLFNASFIKKNDLFFLPTIYFEDVEWLVRVMTTAERVQSIDYQVYKYIRRSGSITQSIQSQRMNKVVSDKLYVIDKLKLFSKTTSNKNVSLWCKGMISIIFIGLLAYVEKEMPERKNEVISVLHDGGYLPLTSYRFTMKQNRDIMIINISPRLFCFLKSRK
jgi:glycosyltransferase involved in cell wall biosynthesis